MKELNLKMNNIGNVLFLVTTMLIILVVGWFFGRFLSTFMGCTGLEWWGYSVIITFLFSSFWTFLLIGRE